MNTKQMELFWKGKRSQAVSEMLEYKKLNNFIKNGNST